ncbi:MAG: amino acid adenylation domain-containing protein, partial [Bacteroidota bacterium]
NTIGVFTNALPFKMDFVDNETFEEFVVRIKNKLRAAYRHQRFPVSQLTIDNTHKLTNNNRLFDFVLSYEKGEYGLDLKNCTSDFKIIKNGGELIPASIHVQDVGNNSDVTMVFDYNNSFLNDWEIDSIKTNLLTLLETIVENPAVHISDISVLKETEINKILNEFNYTSTKISGVNNVISLFEKNAKSSPDKVAYEDSECRISYSELNKSANKVAHFLIENYNPEPENIIGIISSNSLNDITLILGILKTGAAFLPMNKNNPNERTRLIFKESGTKIIIKSKHNFFQLDSCEDCVVVDIENINSENDTNPDIKIKSSSLAYVIYTSGSTGTPKGVMIEHKSLISAIECFIKRIGLTNKDRMLQFSNLAFDASLIEIFMMLIKGGTVIGFDRDEYLVSEKFVEYIERLNVTVMDPTPSFIHSLGKIRFKTVKKLISAADVAIIEDFLFHAEYLEIFNAYGPTETAITSTIYKHTGKLISRTVPIGKPFDNLKFYILSPNMELLPVGATGDVYISGIQLARGYLNNPTLTSEKFISNPYEKNKKLYKTGDLGRWLPDGNIEFFGRADKQVKIRGNRVELGEIESLLMLHPEIRNSAVIVKNINCVNELYAFIVSEKELNISDIIKFLQVKLPEYMIPACFIFIDEIPLNASGKVDRKYLERISYSQTHQTDFIFPKNKAENTLLKIWQDILNSDNISTNDNFFYIGGHSLKATQLASKIYNSFKVEVKIRDIYDKPTIAEQALFVSSKSNANIIPIEPLKEADYYLCSGIQQRLWFLHNLDSGSAVYNMPAVYEIEDSINVDILRQSLQILVSNNEILRTKFEIIDGEVKQLISNNFVSEIEYFDFSDSDDESLNKLVSLIIGHVFDLNSLPLFKLVLIKLNQEKHIFVFNIHHIICDGLSLNLFLKMLFGTYSKLSNNENLPDDKQRIHYKDFAVWHNKLIDTEGLNKQKEFWMNLFKNEFEPVYLPTDKKRPAVQTYNGNIFKFRISDSKLTEIRNFCKSQNTTLFSYFSAILNLLIYKYTLQNDVIIGTVVANRNHPDIESQLGCFINTIALRTIIEDNYSFSDLLNQVKQNTLTSIENGNYPFELLVNDLNLPRDTTRSPLFDIMISMNSYEKSDFIHGNLKLKPYDFDYHFSKYDLTFDINENSDEITVAVEYNTDLFLEETIDRLCKHFNLLVDFTLKFSDDKLTEINILTASEKKLLDSINNTNDDFKINKSLIEEFKENVNLYGDRTALIFGNKHFSYRQIDYLSDNIANELDFHLVENKTKIVGIMLDRSEYYIASIFGVLKTGSAYLPIDPDTPHKRIKFMLAQSGCNTVITDSQYSDKFNKKANIIDINKIEYSDIQSYKSKNSNDSPAYVIFTSGSTGKPKGVVISCSSVQNLVHDLQKSIYSGISSKIKSAFVGSYTFDASVAQIFGCLLNGHTLIGIDNSKLIDIKQLIKYFEETRPDLLDLTPSLLDILIEAGFNNRKFDSVSHIISGGESLQKELLEKFYSNNINSNITIYNSYGPTEATVDTCRFELNKNNYLLYDNIPIGKPISNVMVHILDINLKHVPIGAVGELYISGINLASGYIADTVQTFDRFVILPEISANKLYRTGDLCRISNEGNIEFIGRNDNQIKIRGFRIELEEIENAIQSYSQIKQVVAQKRNNRTGEAITAFFTTDSNIEIAKLKSHLSTLLPAYMIPVFYKQLDTIPLTSGGKLNRNALPAHFDSEKSSDNSQISEIERKILDCWQITLNNSAIGIQDNYFDAGGNSLSLVKLHNQLDQIFPGKFQIIDLFSHPTIHAQSQYLLKNNIIDKTENVINRKPDNTENCDIAIIGIALKVSDAVDLEGFWEILRSGRDCICEFPIARRKDVEERYQMQNGVNGKIKYREMAFLPEIDKFDYSFFKMSPRDASLIDPKHRLFLETAMSALEDAGYGGMSIKGTNTGIYIGDISSNEDFSEYLKYSLISDYNQLLTASVSSVLASRLAYYLDLKGPAISVDTACSSALVATHLACNALKSAEIDTAIAGGVKVTLSPIDTGIRVEIESDDSRTHAFDESASGTGGGEGVIAIVLKRLTDAVQSHDNIYAVIKGSAINQDGRSIGITAPNPTSQSEVIEQAWKNANVNPESISYIEAHGTGTALGDPIEIQSINNAYKKYTDKTSFVAVSAVKSNIGHLDNLAGLAGLVKA